MMIILKCQNCGGESIALDAISVNVQLSRSEWCEHCRKSGEKKENYFFCSLKCFHNYMNKVSIGELPTLDMKD